MGTQISKHSLSVLRSISVQYPLFEENQPDLLLLEVSFCTGIPTSDTFCLPYSHLTASTPFLGSTPQIILGPQGSASLVGDGCLLSTVWMEEQAFRFCLGSRSSTAESTLWGQSPQDGIVPAETITVVIIMDDGHFYRHPIQIYYTIYHRWCQWSSYTWSRRELKNQI